MAASPTCRSYSVVTKRSGTRATTLHRLKAPDGVDLSLSRLEEPAANDAVLLIHGLTTSSDMYVMPEHYNLAAYLSDHGFDVWAADFRMSNHFAYNTTGRYTFEDIGVNDWPAIVGFIRKNSRAQRLHVICHCLGSVTFHVALYGKTIEGISSVVSNSVSLNPRVSIWSAVKLMVAPFLVEKVLRLPFMDPRFSERRNLNQPWIGRLIARAVGLVHLECNSDACNLLSFTWGNGFPALYQHDTMAKATHDRLTELFGPVAMPYFRNVRKAVLSNCTLVRYGNRPEHQSLPERYIDNVGAVRVPTLLLSGDKNGIFPGSNKLTAAVIREKGVPGYEYAEIPGYGHQDVFMGERTDVDVFPTVLKFLQRVAAA